MIKSEWYSFYVLSIIKDIASWKLSCKNNSGTNYPIDFRKMGNVFISELQSHQLQQLVSYSNIVGKEGIWRDMASLLGKSRPEQVWKWLITYDWKPQDVSFITPLASVKSCFILAKAQFGDVWTGEQFALSSHFYHLTVLYHIIPHYVNYFNTFYTKSATSPNCALH